MTPPQLSAFSSVNSTPLSFVGKFNSVEFRRYMADVLRQAVFKCVGNGVYCQH